MLRQLGLVVPKTPLFQRSFNTATYLRREYSDKDWQPNLDNVVNQAVAQEPANNASVPNSMLASFKNMFDRGPNVGIEVLTTYGFVLSNNVKVEEPVMLINGSCFLWNAPPPTKDSHMPMQDWDLDTFKIFELVSPKPGL
jgi:hypothetical protein